VNPLGITEIHEIDDSPVLLFKIELAEHGFWVVKSQEEDSGDFVGSVGFKIINNGVVEVGNPPHGMSVEELKRGKGNAVRLMQQALSASKTVWNCVLKMDGHPNCIAGIQGDGIEENCRHFWVERVGVPEKYLHIYLEPICDDPNSRFESKNNLDSRNLMYRIDGRIYEML